MTTSLVLLLLSQADPTLEAIHKAIDETARAGYGYSVKGRFERSGEFVAPGLLTSRIKQYQSVRFGREILVKGPEGLWKTPGERLGEKVQNPDKEAPDIVRTLEEAGPPHAFAEELLAQCGKPRDPEDRELERVMCRRYLLTFTKAALRESLEKQMKKAIAAGQMERPHEVQWSTAKGSLCLYAGKADGRLVKMVDVRSVKIAYQEPDQAPEIKTYKIEMEFLFSPAGKDGPDIPREVRERLGVKDD
jgi:hypothetical protein